MILPYGAGGVPGRGEIPMSSVSNRTPVDFLLRIWGIHYRTDYPDADAYTMQFLLDGYEDSICPDGVAAAGKAAYVERNQAMIQASDFCVFYFNNEYLPASRKESKKAITSYQPKSGTGVAFDYAKAHGRTIINLYEEDEHCN